MTGLEEKEKEEEEEENKGGGDAAQEEEEEEEDDDDDDGDEDSEDVASDLFLEAFLLLLLGACGCADGDLAAGASVLAGLAAPLASSSVFRTQGGMTEETLCSHERLVRSSPCGDPQVVSMFVHDMLCLLCTAPKTALRTVCVLPYQNKQIPLHSILKAAQFPLIVLKVNYQAFLFFQTCVHFTHTHTRSLEGFQTA